MAASARSSMRIALAATGVLVALGFSAASAPSQSARSAAAKTLSVSIVNAGALDEGTPWGQVRSNPPGIACPPTCSAPFEAGTAVELVSTAIPGYELAGWSALPNAAGCEQGPTCSLTIDDSGLAPSVTASFQPAAELQAVTAGPGTLLISPVQPGANAVCEVDAQQENPAGSTCIQRYPTGTRVTLTARPDAGGPRFVGWSDFGCANTSSSCTVTLAAGVRYLTARFSPVTLTVQRGAFGSVTITPRPGGTCTFTEGRSPCEVTYASGTVVTLRRQQPAAGNFWIGGCDGNQDGTLDADVCRLRLQGDELVGAGLNDVTAIPPPKGAGITITRRGSGRGKVTGTAGGRRLDCGSRCSIPGLTRYSQIRVVATGLKGSRFVRWSDGNRLSNRVIQLSKINRIGVTFARRSSRRR